MKLKFKPLHLGSGAQIAFINSHFAKRYNISQGNRIEVIHNEQKFIMLVNVIDKVLHKTEISFSDEALEYLKLKSGAEVRVSLALEPESTRFIFKKMNNETLSKKEIFSIIQDIVNNSLNEAEIAYFVSGVYHNGMTFQETLDLTEAIAKTGKILKWGKKLVADKHSIGGIAGNRTTPIVVSICSAAGIIMPKTSSRAITSAAGTADVMETLTNINLSTKKLKQVVKKTNACLAWGGSLGLAPADDKLIRVERLLNLDPESQLLASIIAKKISVGSTHILIDIPYGKGAKVSLHEAKLLAEKFIKIGSHFNLKIHVIFTDGSQPIGNGIGPVLEMLDVLKVLKRQNSPKDLENKAILLAANILEFSNKTKKGQGEILARSILESGKAYKKFQEIISAQGRIKSKLQIGKFHQEIKASKNSIISHINNKSINYLARILGCPTNPSSGIYLHKHKGESVSKGEIILTMYSEMKNKLKEAAKLYPEISPIKFQ